MPRYVRFTALLVSLLLVTSCSSDPLEDALGHIARGDKAFQASNYPEAILEYKIAIQRVDISSLAHYKLAEAYVKADELRSAYGEYLRAADLDLRNDEYQIKAGNMLLLSGRFQEAKNRARTVLERDADNVPAIVLLGNALVGLRDYESATELGKKVIELDPNRPGGYRNLGVVELVRGNGDSAEQAFKRAIQLDSKSVRPVMSLAELYRARKDYDQAAATLKQALAIDPKSVAANSALGSLYIEMHRPADAEPYVKAAADNSSDPNDRLALADYYMGMGRLDDARALLSRLKADPDALVAANVRLAVITYASGDRGRGQQLMDEAVAAGPKDPIALSMKARLLLSDNDVEGALAMAKSAVSADPRSTEAQLMLGRVYLARKEDEPARTALNEALRLGAIGIEAQLELARLHLDRGEFDTAIDFAKQGLDVDPGSLDAQLLLIQGMAAKSDDEGKAEAALRALTAKYPRSPRVYNLLGTLALRRNDKAAARTAWEHALSLDEVNVDALGGLAALRAEAGQPHEAWALVNERIRVAGRNAGLLLLGAKVRIINHDPQGAEDLLRKAIDVNPSTLDAYSLLGQIYVSQHRIDDAKTQFLEMLKQQPRAVGLHTMMALLCRADNDLDGAIGWYKKALQIDPRAAVPANNLAAIYSSQNTELEAAQRLAEVARGSDPNQAAYHDTLGWVYYKRGLVAQAIETLYRAVQLDPNNAVSRYHLGMAYVQDGTDPKARQQLQVALALDPKFPQADEAKQALDKLVY